MASLENPKTKRTTWDETFISLASLISKRTACKFHEAGVVFVDENHRIISLGYNGPTEGDFHCLEVGCAKVDGDPETKKLKRCRGAHAEINGIMNARKGLVSFKKEHKSEVEMKIRQLKKMADFVIDNNQNLSQLFRSIDTALVKIIRK